MTRACRLAATAAILFPLGAATAHPQASPCPRAALTRLQPLIGSWNVDWESRVNDTLVAITGATALVARVAGQCGILEQLAGQLRGEPTALTTVIAAPTNDSLQLAYVDSGHGDLLVFMGGQRGDTIQFVWRHDWGDHVQIVRREYSAITAAGFVTQTLMSPDGGAQWLLVQRARYRRRS